VVAGTDVDRARVALLDTLEEQKQVEAALRESSEFNRQIITSANAGIIVYGHDLRIEAWNPFMEQMTGVPAKDILGRHPWEACPFLREAGIIPTLKNVLKGETVGAMEFPYHIPETGRSGWALDTRAPLRNATGEIIGIIATVRDITARKQAEEALHDLSHRLLKAQDEERRRIARELHDSTTQDLVAVMLTLDSLHESLAGRGDQEVEKLDDSLAILEKCAHDIRTLSYLLHPPRLDDAGLVDAIRHYTDGFAERTSVAMSFELPEDLGPLPEEVELILFRVTQECLANVHRHAHSPMAAIRLTRDASATVLEVSDAGGGVPAAILEAREGPAPGLGVGIPGMRERLRQIGGRLEIESSSRGTTVRAILPASNGKACATTPQLI